MKTDTEDTVRVTITFNRASNPEWYNVISGITSGRARSEIVKTHLTVPSLERFARNRREPPLAAESAGEKINSCANIKINSFANSNLNSSEISTGPAGQKGTNYDEKKIVDFEQNLGDLGDVAAPKKQGGGLASHFVKAGFKSV